MLKAKNECNDSWITEVLHLNKNCWKRRWMWFRQYVLEIGTAPSKDKYLLLRRTLHILFIINHDFHRRKEVSHATSGYALLYYCGGQHWTVCWWLDRHSTRGFPKTVETLEQMIILHLVMAQNFFCCVPVALQCTGVNSWWCKQKVLCNLDNCI